MSEMNSRNKTGPSTVPWGIPEITEDGDEIASFEIMYCFLFVRKLHSVCLCECVLKDSVPSLNQIFTGL